MDYVMEMIPTDVQVVVKDVKGFENVLNIFVDSLEKKQFLYLNNEFVPLNRVRIEKFHALEVINYEFSSHARLIDTINELLEKEGCTERVQGMIDALNIEGYGMHFIAKDGMLMYDMSVKCD